MKKRILSIVLTLCMALMLIPTTAFAGETAGTGTSTAPSVTAYATKEQLMNNTFAPNANGTANNIGKLAFGSNGNTPQEWYILGKDDGVTGDNAIIFATDTMGAESEFNSNVSDKTYNYSAGTGYGDSAGSIKVYANHYGASDFRNNLNSMVSDANTTYFSSAEKNLLNATTVTTYDTKNNLYYTTTDKLYALSAIDNGDTATMQAGSQGQVALARNSYWNNENGFFTRTAASIDGIMCTDKNMPSGLNAYGVLSSYAVRPASNLNLSNVLFASAATGGAGDKITSGMPLKLRFNGSKKAIGEAGYNAEKGFIIARKDPNAKEIVWLVIQGNNGKKDWFYSIKVEGTVELTAEQISDNMFDGQTGISLGNCKIWLETNEGGLTYAVNADSNIYSITLNTNGGTINSGNRYGYFPGSNITLPTDITRPGHVFEGWYDNVKFQGNPITVISTTDYGNKTLYAKWKHPSKTITTKATVKADGSIVDKCSECEETLSTTVIPKASGINLSATSYTYDGKTKTPAVKVSDAKGNTISSGNYAVSYANGRKNVGSYKVTVTLKGNYEGSKTLSFNINPKGTSISKVTGAKKAFTVKWKKQSTKMAKSTITGYQIGYSTSSKMTGAKIKTVMGYKYTSKKITKIKAKKKYYVQVRTYKTVSGKTYYSSWSKVKSVKTK